MLSSDLKDNLKMSFSKNRYTTDIDEETIDLFIKNKTYFKKIRKWDYKLINKILYWYYEVHKSLTKTEIDVLDIGFDG